jgi:hypothetical protein
MAATKVWSSAFDIDCDKLIGAEKFTFYWPIHISDFIISLWSKERMGTTTNAYYDAQKQSTQSNYFTTPACKQSKFSMTIYENGDTIDLRRDGRFVNMPCAQKLARGWSEDALHKEEVDTILGFLYHLSSVNAGN